MVSDNIATFDYSVIQQTNEILALGLGMIAGILLAYILLDRIRVK